MLFLFAKSQHDSKEEDARLSLFSAASSVRKIRWTKKRGASIAFSRQGIYAIEAPRICGLAARKTADVPAMRPTKRYLGVVVLPVLEAPPAAELPLDPLAPEVLLGLVLESLVSVLEDPPDPDDPLAPELLPGIVDEESEELLGLLPVVPVAPDVPLECGALPVVLPDELSVAPEELLAPDLLSAAPDAPDVPLVPEAPLEPLLPVSPLMPLLPVSPLMPELPLVAPAAPEALSARAFDLDLLFFALLFFAFLDSDASSVPDAPEAPDVLDLLESDADCSRAILSASAITAAARAGSVLSVIPLDELCALLIPASAISDANNAKDTLFIFISV